MADKQPEIGRVVADPRWQPKVRFRASHAGLRINIPNTEIIRFTPDGRRCHVQRAQAIQFVDGVYEADGNKYILRQNPATGDLSEIDEVTLMFSRPEFVQGPNGPGGANGIRFWVDGS